MRVWRVSQQTEAPLSCVCDVHLWTNTGDICTITLRHVEVSRLQLTSAFMKMYTCYTIKSRISVLQEESAVKQKNCGQINRHKTNHIFIVHFYKCIYI